MTIISIEKACLERKLSRHEAALSYFHNKVISLYKDKKERRLPDIRQQEFASAGSGILLSISGRKFLITAGHVLRHATYSPIWLLIDGVFESFGGNWRITREIGGAMGSGPIDYGWIELDSDLSEKMSSNSFVAEDRIVGNIPNNELRGYTIIGHPHSKNKKFFKDIDAGTWSYSSEAVTPETDNLKEYQEHIFVSYNPKNITNVEGKKVPNPVYPQGVSRGAFIDLGDFRDPSTLLEDTAPTPKLSGVFIEYKKTEYILIGLKIGSVINDIKRECSL